MTEYEQKVIAELKGIAFELGWLFLALGAIFIAIVLK